RFWIWCPSSEHQRDFNPPDQCAARRTLWPLLTPAISTCPLEQAYLRLDDRSPRVSSLTFPARLPDLPPWLLIASGFVAGCRLALPHGLRSGSCPSGCSFAASFLQTPSRDDALALG
ncbi:MAG TPA: hypothetical protein VLA72_15450, partial [Anaerolineales bacterium]|nr:hypothetical protein [Anaerolineales bacterium]